MTKGFSWAGTFGVTVALGLIGATSAQAQSQGWSSVIDAAKKEGSVSVYHAQLGAPHWKAVVKAFEAKYGIRVEEFDARASELTERIRVEQTSQHYVADVEFHGDSSILQQRATNFIAEHGDIPNAARLFINHLLEKESQVTYAKAWMGTVTQGVVEALDDPDAKRFAQVKLMGSIPYADRESLLKRATEMFK